MELAKILGVSFALATLVEGMVEYVLGTLFQKLDWQKKWSWVLMYVSLGVGVALAFYYKLDLIALISGQSPTVVGHILSGLIIGRGANYLHDFVSAHILKPKYG